MFVLLTTSIFLAVLAVFAVFAKKRRRKSPESLDSAKNPPLPVSLFAPNTEELRHAEREEKIRSEAARRDAEKHSKAKAKAEKIAALQDLLAAQASEPSMRSAAAAVDFAAQIGDGEIFAATAERILAARDENRFKNLSHKDLADLLESHLRLLPQQERASGVIFRLREEIAALRTKSDD